MVHQEGIPCSGSVDLLSPDDMQVAMVNSSWTKDHIATLWCLRLRPPELVYPPCDTADLQRLPLDRKLKRLLVLSVAQFRPEKNQELQLRALAALLRKGAEGGAVRLVFVGGVRGDADRRRMLSLQRLAADLGIQDVVEFRCVLYFCVNEDHAV